MAPRVVGIDLGTTNCAVAWIEAGAPPVRAEPQLFPIAQLVAPGEVAARGTLPSFLYFPTDEERASGTMALPWDAAPEVTGGVLAREHGALVPARQVSSAKSWLSNPAVDRRAAILPWTAEGAARLSPVEASARLLAHLREAWNLAHAGDAALRLEAQDVVLTVPASFDEEARELTVEAAAAAGLERLTLLEEPLAAVYAWIASHPEERRHTFADGQQLLVCDVGGGTSDFSLLRAALAAGHASFERTAIGEHLLLGGDNVDLALAARVEPKLGGARLTLTQRQALRRQCSAAKERLLAEGAPPRVAITVLGAGRGVVGGALSAELTREETLATLEEFLPLVPREARPGRPMRGGLRELGLPYESDPAVTRHLAAFLARAARAAGTGEALVRPDAVLFNGGFFTPPLARERILDALASWFGARPRVLVNNAPEAAVAIGAAFYGGLRRHAAAATGLLIRAGSPRAYYIAVQDGEGASAVCVMPRGTQEGTRLALDRELTVIANQPAAFTLMSSTERADQANALVAFGPAEEVHRHAPLVTALRYGQRSRRVPIAVRLTVLFTEVGTLELWCESQATEHRWRLQFNLRAQEAIEPQAAEAAADQVVIADEAIERAQALLRAAFRPPAAGRVDTLMGELENALGHGKQAWPLPVIRRLADVLLELREGRRITARHEARWLNLTGFCLRPGFGTSLDPFRVGEARKVYAAGLAHPRDVQCQVEWLILWQRVAAGFAASQQQELANRLAGTLGLGARKAPRMNPQMVRETWRLLAGLERLERARRARLGDELLARLRREPQNDSFVWALGRFGARVPFYGPLSSVVAPEAAERWLDALIALKSPRPEAWAAIASLAVKTDDPARDVSAEARERAIAALEAAGASADAVREPAPVDRLRGARIFGEALPEGLRL